MTHEHGQQTHQHVRPHAGESAPFHFENTWRVDASPTEVWSVLSDVKSWPQWWPGLPVAVPVDDRNVPGRRAEIQVESPIGVTLSFGIELQDTDPPSFVSFSATGDLRGTVCGRWSRRARSPRSAPCGV
ncbi:SRPBCC family protein [Brevibacterium sp. UCMA 11754]|uniref:SRPBCC family protein n=1 Tax=Brevibacterium sp. UCMA 11754 TaxID=2749198 RepID=UPI001F283542|nr:SRPBCC family protein [Brevibacterium sp. UCMA 11754]